MSLLGRDDLALNNDPARRFLPGLLAMIVFLAILALAGMISLGAVVDRWDRGLTGTATVELPALAGDVDGDPDNDPADIVRRAVETLERTPGVLSARPLSREETAELIEPWLGEQATDAALPLPRLIDVTIRTDAPPDMEGLGNLLSGAVPGAVIHDHRATVDKLVRLARAIELVALMIVVVVGLAAIATVIFITRTGLAIHRNAIELLHLIGASDSYVARQFQAQTLKLGLKGGILGLFLGGGTLWILGRLSQVLGAELLPDMSFTPIQWAAICAVPLVLTLIAMITARLTVLSTLRQLA